MIVSWNWLAEYLPLNMPVESLADRLMMSGCNLESIEKIGGDHAIDLEITSNRPDCLSHLGIAREAGVLFNLPVTEPNPTPAATGPETSTLTSVALDAPDLCPRYIARVIRGVKVGDSPGWLKARLETLGLRPVNNIVDITNYVLMEFGQPLHAFDFDLLNEKRIVVRHARQGEKIAAIDGKTYELSPEMCVIADANRPVAIAGVMGGADTEIGANTKNILLEVADFATVSVRSTARKLGLHSDSSHRFERGIDRSRMARASLRACELILQLAGGELCPGAIDVGPGLPPETPTIRLRHERIAKLLGIEIDHAEVARILTALGLEPDVNETLRIDETLSNDETLSTGVSAWRAPVWRKDLSREVDLIEEVARIHGYHHIPEDAIVPLALSQATPRDKTIDRLSNVLVGAGFFEAVTLSFVSPEMNGLLRPWTQAAPLSVDHSTRRRENALRQSLLPRLLEVRRANERHGTLGAEVFEFSRVFLSDDPAVPGSQPELLGIVGGKSFGDLKGLLVALADSVRHELVVKAEPAKVPGLIPGRAAKLTLNGQDWGVLGEITPEVRAALELRETALVAEVRLDPLIEALDTAPKYRPIPEFPGMERDINFVLDEGVAWGTLEATVREAAGPLLEDMRFDSQYRGAQIPADKKSYVFRLSYRAPDRTLTADEVDAAQKQVITACIEKLGAVQR